MIDPVFDPEGLFVWLPSAVMAAEMEAAGELFEGKSIGTAKEQDLVLLQDPTIISNMDPDSFAKQRKSGATVGRRALKKTMDRTETDLVQLIEDFEFNDLPEKKLRDGAKRVMRKAWREVFIAGVRAGGSPPTKTPGVLTKVSPVDEKWLKSAMAHEMTFLNKFLSDVVAGRGKMPYEKRAEMYVRALTSFYESARVMALPATSIIRWSGPNDKRTCPSCAYLFAHNPFTKKTLPTTPRSGMTVCLTNCRDRLLIRRATPDEVLAVEKAGLTRGTHIKNLRKIKSQGHL